jgi:DNA-directed RNA polymerase subunit F
MEDNVTGQVGKSKQTDALIKQLSDYVNDNILPKDIRVKYTALKDARKKAVELADDIQKLFSSGDNEKAMKALLKLTKNSSIFKKEIVENIKDINPDLIDEIYGFMGRPATLGGTNRLPITTGAMVAGGLGSKVTPFVQTMAAVTLATSPKLMTNL